MMQHGALSPPCLSGASCDKNVDMCILSLATLSPAGLLVSYAQAGASACMEVNHVHGQPAHLWVD